MMSYLCKAKFSVVVVINIKYCFKKCRARNEGGIAQYNSMVGEISQSSDIHIPLASNHGYLKMK